MQKLWRVISMVLCLCLLGTATAMAAGYSSVRLKDVAKVQGVRNNQLMGYGLVVGLNGTGDSNKMTQTIQSIGNMMREYGVGFDTNGFKPKNVAAVIVTATLPPFVREGDSIDITVSSMGDAKSIQGGTLLQTPLKAGNGNVYAVAMGAVSTGGFTAGRGSSTAQKNFPTVGTTPNGAIVERSVDDDDLAPNGTLSWSLTKSDFTTANRIAQAINAQYGGIAKAANPGRVDVIVPAYYRNNIVGFIANMEDLIVTPDNIAKVVVNERTGTIVMGGDVSVDTIAVTQGGITVDIGTNYDVIQPPPFSHGNTVVVPNDGVNVTDQKGSSIVLPATANVNDIVGALNSVGATPRDIISILQAIKAAGALHADLELI